MVAGQENTPLGIPDIRIPVVKHQAGRPRHGREGRRSRRAERRGRRGETVLEDTATGERRTQGPPKERSCLEQLTPGESLNEGQGSPETLTLCHVPGGAWLRQVRSCLQSRINALVGREEGEKGRKGLKVEEKGLSRE
ncbi:hypothetical protein NDU88_001200 [Pleurodeles waltl]|uniref:Uncharacterized protein n=1 Tax=Pleurodeles waltl TaxID=8319 RepID=A0AAV7TGX8_PLEWA|nr:hypothetical protein NDU88_001200 [Pleurodeles waltl]